MKHVDQHIPVITPLTTAAILSPFQGVVNVVRSPPVPTDVGQHKPDMAAGKGTSRSMKPAAGPRSGGNRLSRRENVVGEDGSPHDEQLCGVDVGPAGLVRAEGPVAHEAPVVVVLAGGGHEFLARVGVAHANVPQVDVGVPPHDLATSLFA